MVLRLGVAVVFVGGASGLGLGVGVATVSNVDCVRLLARFESTLDEIKTHLGGTHLVLRSRHPDGAEQELYGFLLVHHAIRHLMHEAAADGDTDPDRISFIRSLRVARRQVHDQAAFSPRQPRLRRQAHAR